VPKGGAKLLIRSRITNQLPTTMKQGLLFTTFTFGVLSMSASAAIVINEVYSGGGSSSATAAYKTDFIELFNNGLSDIDVTGFTLAYGASAQAAGSFPTVIGTLGSLTLFGVAPIIPAGGTLLVQTGASGTGGANDVSPDYDFNTGASLSATSGGIRLQDALASTLDVVGYGTTNNFETAPATAPANIGLSLQRVAGLDANNNSTDFTNTFAPTPVALGAVPEPATVLSLIFGAGVIIARHRRRR
jgi:hypothetical protein